MKTCSLLLLAFAMLVSVPQTARAQDDQGAVSFDLFYQALEPLGHWILIDGYGYAWQPYSAAEDPGWRPYTIGSWCHTDAGWTWMSEEEFGWAVYHYGRWVKLTDIGWAWIPGYDWAPAWVTWRRSQDDEYLGWAPLPPEAEYDRNIGFSSWVDDYYDIGPTCYVFVHVTDFCSRRLRPCVLPYERNVVIIQRSINITNICYRPSVVTQIFVGGPELVFVENHCREPVRRYSLVYDDGRALDIFRRDPRAGCHELFRRSGNNLIVSAPRLAIQGVAQIIAPQKIKHHVDSNFVDRGWQGKGIASAQDQLRATMKQDAARAPVQVLPPKVMHATPVVGGNSRPVISKPGNAVVVQRPEVIDGPDHMKHPVKPGNSVPKPFVQTDVPPVKPNIVVKPRPVDDDAPMKHPVKPGNSVPKPFVQTDVPQVKPNIVVKPRPVDDDAPMKHPVKPGNTGKPSVLPPGVVINNPPSKPSKPQFVDPSAGNRALAEQMARQREMQRQDDAKRAAANQMRAQQDAARREAMEQAARRAADAQKRAASNPPQSNRQPNTFTPPQTQRPQPQSNPGGGGGNKDHRKDDDDRKKKR